MKKITALLLALLMLMSTALSVSATTPPQPKRFTDVSKSAWYADNVNYVTENGLMKGTSENTFSPDMTLSRAMVVTIIYRMAGEPVVEGIENKFTDVPADEWYTSAVLWANENGIVYGRDNKTYDPSDDITRQELAVMLFRYVKKYTLRIPQDIETPDYADAEKIYDFAEFDVKCLSRAGIINGKDGNKFDPHASATRAEAAAIISRFVKKASVQDFSFLEKLGITIRAEPQIWEEGNYGAHYSQSFDVLIKLNGNTYNPEDFTVYTKLWTDYASDKGYLRFYRSYTDSFCYSIDNPSVIFPFNFEEASGAWTEVTITYAGESATYQLFTSIARIS